ncbi:putative nuclease HARBI1 [Carcharodon carcharias]|uniref:putative nuclease HARBI1 n=1 Tax=Carcharodon carcharias TaxID=13397 RepID=UPI001B7F18C7|nr:putative nuclease HARBI1 [Carcharodon carcharias]
MSEELCARQLRFSKEAIRRLCDILQEDLRPSSKCRTALSVATKVTTALNFYACGSFQSSVGDMCKITQSAARACIHQVTDAVFRRASDFIHFDMSPSQASDRAIRFHRIAGFPKVLGVIGGTHIQLKAPNDEPVSYINRRGFHSLNVMIICDAQMRILNVNADQKGSADDALVLENSNLYHFMSKLPQRAGWLLGDNGYPLKTWLMVPYSRAKNEAQESYNRAHVCTRQRVEGTIRLLKSRFRCLDRTRGILQYSPVKVSKIVVACCALHNFALQEGLALPPTEEGVPEAEEMEDEDVDADGAGPQEEPQEAPAAAARAAREQLVDDRFGL